MLGSYYIMLCYAYAVAIGIEFGTSVGEAFFLFGSTVHLVDTLVLHCCVGVVYCFLSSLMLYCLFLF
jgi:hypothetical protein